MIIDDRGLRMQFAWFAKYVKFSIFKGPIEYLCLDLAQALEVFGEERITPEMRDILLPSYS